MVINIKPYSRRDLAILIDAIATQTPGVKLDAYTAALRQGITRSIEVKGVQLTVLAGLERLLWRPGGVLILAAIMGLIWLVKHWAGR